LVQENHRGENACDRHPYNNNNHRWFKRITGEKMPVTHPYNNNNNNNHRCFKRITGEKMPVTDIHIIIIIIIVRSIETAGRK
jgi:hypothetical protein